MIDFKIFNIYCNYARDTFKAKGTFIYNERAKQQLSVAGWPYPRLAAHNDNEANP